MTRKKKDSSLDERIYVKGPPPTTLQDLQQPIPFLGHSQTTTEDPQK